ncbi:MAG: hypothetical protein KJZ93_26185, partial [Caldilineaceae bacterium]|nr:hypothetical protein [Caldilineaceae bacterium]
MLRLSSLAQTLLWDLRRVHEQLTSTTAIGALAALGALSALLYWWGFAAPFSLLAYHDRPLLDLFRLVQFKPEARALLISVFLAQGALYWLGWRVAQRAQGRLAWWIVVGWALLF